MPSPVRTEKWTGPVLDGGECTSSRDRSAEAPDRLRSMSIRYNATSANARGEIGRAGGCFMGPRRARRTTAPGTAGGRNRSTAEVWPRRRRRVNRADRRRRCGGNRRERRGGRRHGTISILTLLANHLDPRRSGRRRQEYHRPCAAVRTEREAAREEFGRNRCRQRHPDRRLEDRSQERERQYDAEQRREPHSTTHVRPSGTEARIRRPDWWADN